MTLKLNVKLILAHSIYFCVCVFHMITKKKSKREPFEVYPEIPLFFMEKWDLKNYENLKGFLYIWYLLSFHMDFHNV